MCGGIDTVRKVVKVEKGATAAPFLTGEVSLPFLAGLLLPALGFLRHCQLSPPSCGFACENAHVAASVAAAWHAHPAPAPVASRHLPLDFGRARSRSPLKAGNLTRGSLS